VGVIGMMMCPTLARHEPLYCLAFSATQGIREEIKIFLKKRKNNNKKEIN
jgi:hypothetical protein